MSSTTEIHSDLKTVPVIVTQLHDVFTCAFTELYECMLLFRTQMCGNANCKDAFNVCLERKNSNKAVERRQYASLY